MSNFIKPPFILGDRITRARRIGESNSYNMYLEADVVEFVKLLLEETKDRSLISFNFLRVKIDELLGRKFYEQ
jgi:hypothetical protein